MARILDQMAVLARERKDSEEERQYSEDAAWIYRALYRSNREAYGDRLALALLGSAAVGVAGKNNGGVCELLDEALLAARASDVQYRVSQARAKASCPRETAVRQSMIR